jgi:putative sugar O-methyltransferase
LSDNQAYPHFCLQASHDFRVFDSFRRNPIYNQILEHVSRHQGHEYLRILSRDPVVMEHIDAFRANDDWGNPRVYGYPDVGTFSPTTLRYIKVLADLKAHFRTLDGLRICEIGVGYGGQCRVVNALFQPSAYWLVDIQPALSLAQRYLDHYALPTTLTYSTMNELPETSFDLVISNYAFTELPRGVQDVYLRKVIRNARRGYISYNEITPADFRSYRARELAATIPGATIVAEEPLTHANNCILVWGADA